MRLSSNHLNFARASKDGVMDLVTFTFYIKHQRSCLSLDIANQIVVVVELVFWLEYYFNWDLRLGRDHTSYRVHSERISKIWASFNALFGEVEAEWDVLLINQGYYFSILSLKEKRSKLNLTCLEEDVWFIDTTNNKEVLNNILSWNPEDPVRLVFSNIVWSILKDHLGFLTTENKSTLTEALEDWLVLTCLIRDFLPFEFISLTSRIDSHKSSGILNTCTQALKFDNLIFGVHRSHVLFFSLAIVAWWKLEVNDWSLCNTINSDFERFLLWIEIKEIG